MNTHNMESQNSGGGNEGFVNRRDEFDKKVKELLAKRVGSNCSNPGCRKSTSGPHSSPLQTVNIGVAAHITAAAPGGPRYDPNLTPDQRKDATNGIWLCQSCAKMVDNDTISYSKERLVEWKEAAELSARCQIEQNLSAGWEPALPAEIKNLVSLELTTPPPVTRNIGRSDDGQYWLVQWDTMNATYQWSKITEGYAKDELKSVCVHRNVTDWRELFAIELGE